VTRLHHSIQAAFNRTIISLFERKLSQSNVTKPSRKLNSSSTVRTVPDYQWTTYRYLNHIALSILIRDLREPGPRPPCAYKKTIKRRHNTDYVHFKLQLPIPVMTAFQSNLRSWLYQNLSRRFLIAESTETTTYRQTIYSIRQ